MFSLSSKARARPSVGLLTTLSLSDLEHHLRIRILTHHERLQRCANSILRLPQRRIHVDRGHRHCAVASVVDNRGLAWQRPIAIDAHVVPVSDQVLVGEDCRSSVPDGPIGRAAAIKSGLDEGRVDAGVVGERGDEWCVDTNTVSMIRSIKQRPSIDRGELT